MDMQHPRPSAARLRLPVATLVATLALITPATAQVTTDLNDWNLTTSAVVHPSSFHISSGWAWVEYRWLDAPNVGTVISSLRCSDLAGLGGAAYGVGDTTYRLLSSGSSGDCFRLHGRTTSGSLTNHDGRVRR